MSSLLLMHEWRSSWRMKSISCAIFFKFFKPQRVRFPKKMCAICGYSRWTSVRWMAQSRDISRMDPVICRDLPAFRPFLVRHLALPLPRDVASQARNDSFSPSSKADRSAPARNSSLPSWTLHLIGILQSSSTLFDFLARNASCRTQ